jgi:hypothetical protein
MSLDGSPKIPHEDVQFYLEQSPLLRTFLDEKTSDNLNAWIKAIISRLEKTMEDSKEAFDEYHWNHVPFSLDLMLHSLQITNRDLNPGKTTTLVFILTGIGYEIGDLNGVNAFSTDIYKRLNELDFFNPDLLKTKEGLTVTVNAVRGMLQAGSYLKRFATEEDMSLSPFDDFFNNLT